MEGETGAAVGETEGQGPMTDAPSQRAKALRDEIFGSALTLDEASYILSLDRTTVAKYLRENTIIGFQIGREWLIPEEELRTYVRRMIDERREEARQTGEAAWQWPDPDRGSGKGPVPVYKKLFARDAPAKQGFERFTGRARRVLALAQEEAMRLNHTYMGTEHLLLGLLAEGEGLAAQVLRNLGVDLDKARGKVEFIIGHGKRSVEGHVGLTPRAKKVIKLALDEAQRLDHRFVGTEHLLLGLLREGEGIAAGVLEKMGVQLDQARAATLRALEQQGEERADQPAHAGVPPLPAEAVTLLAPQQEGLTCADCGARSPLYFRYCFHCGARLRAA
jgi:excisionase family DNA binding protein